MRATWRLLAGRRDLRLVLSAGIISMTGDWILTIGLIYRVYAVTGSTVASALTMASAFAPQVLLGHDALAGARRRAPHRQRGERPSGQRVPLADSAAGRILPRSAASSP